MSEPDNSLIAEFNARRSEEAFAALVRQHVNLVFATALRQVGDAGAAEELTQNVFVALALAAGKLGSHPTIAGWLHQTALNKSSEWLRSELRRRKRERVAVNLDLARAEGDSVWSPLVPLLDEALLELREPDRQAVILHFMEGQTFQEVGSALGVGEDAARKRVNRCLDQLTQFFRHRGFTVPVLAAGAPFFTLSSLAAPTGLAASATTAGMAAAHSAASASTLTLIKGALKIMAWTKMKTAIVAGAAVILAAGVTTSIIVHDVHQKRAMASKAELTEAGNGAYGLYIHYGIATFANPGEKGTIPASRFAPASLEVQSWAHAAKQAGMTFAVLTAKHESGFCLWDSQDYSYDVGGSPFKGDIIADFIAACKAEGIAPGVHYSIPDEFNEGAVRYNGAVVSPAYFDIIKKHVAELHTLYPDLRVQIFDMSERLSQAQFDELRQIVNRLNPQCIVWGTVRGQAPNHNSDTVIQGWMWTPIARLNQAQSLFKGYQRSQAAGKAFLLNVGPDTTGRIPNDQMAVLMQVKKLID